MTDLELIDLYCEKCRDFINPKLYRDIVDRGLYNIVNHLPKDIKEAKAVARGRLYETGKYSGIQDIEEIGGLIMRLEN